MLTAAETARRLACERARLWHAQNRERAAATDRAYRAANRERETARVRAWRAADPARRETQSAKTERQNRRRARIAQAELVEKVDRAAIIARDRSTCHLCGELVEPDDVHLDHIVPLALGGDHTAANLAVSHARCNLRKGARILSDPRQ